MEWQNGPKDEEQMEVDIGFMPRMEVRATRNSVHVMYGGKDNRDQYLKPSYDYEESIQLIDWKKQISIDKARRNLEVKLYPFKKVNMFWDWSTKCFLMFLLYLKYEIARLNYPFMNFILL